MEDEIKDAVGQGGGASGAAAAGGRQVKGLQFAEAFYPLVSARAGGLRADEERGGGERAREETAVA
jgi:hypothetical protein